MFGTGLVCHSNKVLVLARSLGLGLDLPRMCALLGVCVCVVLSLP